MREVSLFWIGVDWGDNTHAVHVFQPCSGNVKKYQVDHTVEGLGVLVSRIKELGVEHIGGIAVESTRSPLLSALLEIDCPLYMINPKVSENWRQAYTPAGAKSDGGDAIILAQGLWHHHNHLSPVKLDDMSRRALRALTEVEQSLIAQHTSHVLSLKAMLKQYYPYALEFFDDWASPVAWEFLLAFPTAASLAKATKNKLIRFLQARHIGMKPKWQRRIDNRAKALDWPHDSAQEEAYALYAQSQAKMLCALEKELKKLRKRIEESFAKLEDAHIYESLPGAGKKLAPRISVMFGGDQEMFDTADALRELSGTAPVTCQSGKRKVVHKRRACRKKWRDTMHQFAFHSKRKCRWARAYYKLCMARGDNNATALRKLANKWLAIIFRMWKEGTVYDEEKYVESLKKRNSTTYQYMLTLGYVQK